MSLRKQFVFLRRYFSTPHTRRKWLNPSLLLVICAFSIFMIGLLWAPPFSAHGAGPTVTPAITTTIQPTPAFTNTPLPPEFANNSQETVGITFAGAVLVLIVVVGVIVFLPKKS